MQLYTTVQILGPDIRAAGPSGDGARPRGGGESHDSDRGPRRQSSTVPLDWSEVYYTNCPLVSASNVDQELGWTREEFKKIGVEYAFLRSRRENNWYPHYIHNLDNLIRFGGLFPPVARARGHPPDQAAGRDSCSARGRLHAGARPGRHLPDDRAAGEEDRPDEEPEHHQERLVAHPGGAGHRADAADERHDPRRRRDRRVPLPRRLVRQARDAGADEQPVRAVAQARPQARPGVPPAGDRAGERHGRRDLHPEQALPAPAGGHRQVQGDRGPVPLPGLDAAGGQHPRRHHLHRRRWPSSTPSSSSPS